MVLLSEEGAVQFTDMIILGMMSFYKFGTQKDLVAFGENLAEPLDHDWTVINGGGRDNVAWYLAYLDDLRRETGEAMEWGPHGIRVNAIAPG